MCNEDNSIDSLHFPSSDDTSVAILEKHDSPEAISGQNGQTPSAPTATLHFLENLTADTRAFKGIHPIVAHEFHQANLAKLIDKALQSLPPVEGTGERNDESRAGKSIVLPSATTGASKGQARRIPDFISVTRGPGMRSNLLTGLDTAKGLSVAWQVPIVGVHHMQGHLLTPRLVAALDAKNAQSSESAGPVEFPFLSALVSGGHTILVHSTSTVEHSVLGGATDIAIGDCVDKAARAILPPSYVAESKTTMYGKALEAFAFPNGASDYSDYVPPANREEEIAKVENTKWGWKLSKPFADTRALKFSYSGILASVEKQLQSMKAAHVQDGINEEDFLPHEARVALAREVMRVCFEHLASRIVIALETLWEKERANEMRKRDSIKKEKKDAWAVRRERMKRALEPDQSSNTYMDDRDIKTLVVSGGVAANRFLRFLLRSFLDARGFQYVKIIAPPPSLCTDNAAMIGWAGIEMFEQGWQSDLCIKPIRRWNLDVTSDDGGVLGQEGWVRK